MTVEAEIDEVIGREGEYSNNPKDRGGPTRWGITEQVARAYGYKGNMRALPRETAAAIYLRRYWLDVRFDKVATKLPTVADELFDCGINMGQSVAATFLQRSLNVLNRGAKDYPDIVADGAIGAMTLAAIDGYRARRAGAEGVAVLLWMIRALRAGRYVTIAENSPSQEEFEYGWIARQVRMAA